MKEEFKDKSNIIMFDGVCNLCNNSVYFVIKRDVKKKFKFTSLQSEVGLILLNKLDLPIDEVDSIVLVKGDKYFLRSDAILLILKELKYYSVFYYLFILIPKIFRDFIYNIIAKNRYLIFGKKEYCMTPTKDIMERFLS